VVLALIDAFVDDLGKQAERAALGWKPAGLRRPTRGRLDSRQPGSESHVLALIALVEIAGEEYRYLFKERSVD
jgi:hypothetical protein